MGCTPSTQNTGTSRSPDAGTGSPVAVFSNVYPEKGSIRDISPTTFTCPSVSDQESQDVTCGRLFGLSINCCRNCHKPNDRVRGNHRHVEISASLTGLHSLDPESTGLISHSGACSPKAQASLRSSCASLCSVCNQTAPFEVVTADLVSDLKPMKGKASKGEDQICGNDTTNVSGSNCSTCGGKKASIESHNASVTKHSHLSAIVCQHRTEGTNRGHSSDIANKGEKRRKTQTKSKLSEVMRLNDSECFTPINATLNSKDKHNRAAILSNLNDTVSKESAASEAVSGLCCVRHQHRYYRQSVSHHRSACTVCPHKCCFTQLSSMASSLELDQNRLQSAISASAMNSNTPTMANNAAHLDSLSLKDKHMEKCNNAQLHSTWKQSSVRLGRMRIENKRAKVLLVLNKADSQTNTLQLAAQHVDFAVSNANSAEAALNAFVELQPEIVIIDARNFPSTNLSSGSASSIKSSNQLVTEDSKGHLGAMPNVDASHICKSIRNVKGSEFTCILALVTRSQLERDHCDVVSLLQNGFNRVCLHDVGTGTTHFCLAQCLQETCHFGLCVNEFVQLREFELNMQRRLRAASAVFAAIDACKDGVVITGPKHDIQFANNSIEKIFGFRLEDIIGRNAQDYFQSDLIKEDIDEKINNFNDGKEWEGQIYHRRKSGDSVPIWNRILPVNYHNGSPEYIIYVKEFPFLFIEKLMSPEAESSLSYGSLKGLRKTSFDVKSEGFRRPSLAKFNSVSLIEAPITRVINILIAIKESGPSFLAPTLEKAIDILKNSEIFMPQFQGFARPDDQLTSELVSSLINTNKSGVRRMSHEAASNKSSLSIANPQTPTFIQPSLSNVPATVQALLDHDLSWSFNVIELERITNKRPLAWLGLSILNQFNVCQTLQCSESTLRNWLTVIESNYHDNPYHNSTHAADVMQATAHFLMASRLKNLFDPMDQAICLIAAIIHDIDHPGRNSAFLCNSSHELAVLYNDISVLESHHAARGFKLTVGPNSDHVNIFKKLDSDMYRDVRQSVIDMVLATDMTKHFEHLAKFLNVFQSILSDSEPENTESEMESTLVHQPSTSSHAESGPSSTLEALSTPENIVLIKRMLIKCADVSNPARPLKLCQIWAERISTEYCDQTDEEKRKGLPVVMPTFDRLTCSIPKSQIGFIDYFANDMFDAWHSFGYFPEIIDNMNTNYQYWKDQQMILERKQKKLSLESSKVSEGEEEEYEQEGTGPESDRQNSGRIESGKYSSSEQPCANHVDTKHPKQPQSPPS